MRYRMLDMRYRSVNIGYRIHRISYRKCAYDMVYEIVCLYYDIVCQPTISYVDILYRRVPRIQMFTCLCQTGRRTIQAWRGSPQCNADTLTPRLARWNSGPACQCFRVKLSQPPPVGWTRLGLRSHVTSHGHDHAGLRRRVA